MNTNEIRSYVRDEILNTMTDFLSSQNAIQFDDASFAIPVDVEGQTVYAEVTVKTKAWKDTKSTPAFDPTTAIEKWEAEKAEKAAKAAEKASKKKA